MSTAIPKPASEKGKVKTPKLTEDDFLEIGERISEAIEYRSEITITVYRYGNYEKYTGIIKSANAQTKMLVFDDGGLDDLKISLNIIVAVE